MSKSVNPERWLTDLLRNGPVPVLQIEAEAEKAGMTLKTCRRAKERLAKAGTTIQPAKIRNPDTKKDYWTWALTDAQPKDAQVSAQHAQPENAQPDAQLLPEGVTTGPRFPAFADFMVFNKLAPNGGKPKLVPLMFVMGRKRA